MELKANSRGNLGLGSGISLGQLTAVRGSEWGQNQRFVCAEIRDQLRPQAGLCLGQIMAQ